MSCTYLIDKPDLKNYAVLRKGLCRIHSQAAGRFTQNGKAYLICILIKEWNDGIQ
jgi:hypothetical protein